MTDVPNFRSEFLRTFVARGQYYAATEPEALDALFAKERVTAYIGFDCTAPSLHVGSLVQIMTLRRLQQAGHKPIVLMGGGTTKVGDPSGKDETRQLLTRGADRGQQAEHPEDLRALPELRRRAVGRDHGRQRRMARQARIHPVPARHRPAFLDQPMLTMDSVKLQARARPAAELPRIQLHDPAGLRFRGAVPPLRLPAAMRRLGPVGQHRQRHRSRRGASRMRSSSA